MSRLCCGQASSESLANGKTSDGVQIRQYAQNASHPPAVSCGGVSRLMTIHDIVPELYTKALSRFVTNSSWMITYPLWRWMAFM